MQWKEGSVCVCVCVCVWFVYDGGDHMSRVFCVCISPCGAVGNTVSGCKVGGWVHRE